MIDLRPADAGIGQRGKGGIEHQLLQPLIPNARGRRMHRLPDDEHIHA